MRVRILLMTLALAAGCYSPTIGNGELRCVANGGKCPSGYGCIDGACLARRHRPDLSMAADDMGTNDSGGSDDMGCVEDTLICGNATTPQKCVGGLFVDQGLPAAAPRPRAAAGCASPAPPASPVRRRHHHRRLHQQRLREPDLPGDGARRQRRQRQVLRPRSGPPGPCPARPRTRPAT